MPVSVSRRTVAAGAAWSVPVVAVSAAAPAMAASHCPTTLAVLTATAVEGGVSITVRLSPDRPYYCVASITTAISPSPITSWTLACFDQDAGDNDQLALTGTGADGPAEDYRGDYSIYVILTAQGNTCPPQLVTFTAT